MLIFTTCSSFHVQTNITKRIGYFSASIVAPYTDSQDGLFFESDASGISINIMRNGTVVEKTYQSSWNLDKLNGSGPSGITYDWSKNIIFIIDFQYLGLGRVRWAVDVGGVIVPIHQSVHANNLSQPYMLYANQPLRWEIRQSGTGSGIFNAICASVSVEGVQELKGRTMSINNGTTGITIATAATTYAILGIRYAAGKAITPVILKDAHVFATSNTDFFRYSWILNPTVANTFTYGELTNSPIEYAVGANNNTVTDGTFISSAYGLSAGLASMPISDLNRLGIGINGTQDTMVLCVNPLSGSQTIVGVINFDIL
jgi:hypothetical protein